MNKILSIIVPSYNMEKYLPKCLGSLIIDDAELLQKLDVIVVNDGSKDRTSEIAHDVEAKYPGVFRVIDKTNGHYGSCVNAALPVALGTYVKILDADDYVDTTSFEQFCRLAEKESSKGDDSADLLVSNYQSVDPDGKIIESIDYGLDESHGYYTLDKYPEDSPRFTVHSIAYRTEAVRRIGYHQSEQINYTDNEWIIEPMTQVRRFLFQHLPVGRYLIGRDGQSMELETNAQKYQQVADITIGLAERYEQLSKICKPEAQQYYFRNVLGMISIVYFRWRAGLEGHRCNIDIANFDQHIQMHQEFYTRTAELRFTACRFYDYYYVRDWRRSHRRWTFAFLVYLILKKLKRLKNAIFRK